jgi:hypothetical protein
MSRRLLGRQSFLSNCGACLNPNVTRFSTAVAAVQSLGALPGPCLILAAKDPLRILCAREFQVSIKDSVHKLLTDQIYALGLDSFYEITQTTIRGKERLGVLFHWPEEQHHQCQVV